MYRMRLKYYPAKEIIPGLWIGSARDAQDPSFFKAHNIGMQVNVTPNVPQMNLPGVEYYHIQVYDDTAENGVLLSHFPVVVRAIDSVLKRGKGVLVHCAAGMQRSAATVAAYLMFSQKMSADEAMKYINDRKNETFYPRPTFLKALKKYESILEMNAG